jgi:outer membrane protein TolC
MKSITRSIVIILLISLSDELSGQEIKLITCIDSALANRGNILAVRTDIEIAKLQTSSAYQKYLPDLSLSYNYRYNPIIPTQIIPVGQFSQIPADEKRPIKFGTDWQQSSGLNLFQPIIDFSIKSRVAESRINEKLKNTDAAASERDLKLEVIKSFTNIWLRAELLEQQQQSERMKHTPTIGFEGFLGANQYTDTFNPFLSGSWYGSSYMGLSLRFQILSGSNTKNRVNQLKLEEKGLKSRLNDEIYSVSNKSLLLNEEIGQIKYQAGLSKQNIALYEENLSLNKDRFDKGQINAYDLLTDEIDFQKEQSNFNEKRAELVYKQIELINNLGALSSFIDNLR